MIPGLLHKKAVFCMSDRQAMPGTAYKSVLRNLSELTITDTELKLMAVAAIIGDSNRPNNGYNTPAATGTPKLL